jgi:hypothetical protein
MYHKNYVKYGIILLLLMMLALAAMPAMAQGPDDEINPWSDGEVNAQVVSLLELYWDPKNSAVARGDGTVMTSLGVRAAEDISGFTIVVSYNSSVVNPDNIRPGALLPGTRGVDYFWTVQTGVPLPIRSVCPGNNTSFAVHVAYLNQAMKIDGTGHLFEVLWRSDPDAAVGDGTRICVEPGLVGPPASGSYITDNGGLGVPIVPAPSTNDRGSIVVEQSNLFKIQILLEGGKPSWWLPTNPVVPGQVFTEVLIDGFYPCDGGLVQPNPNVAPPGPDGYCAFNNATTLPPYNIEVERFGYLPVEATFGNGSNASTIFMLAGDLNEDNVINILDIQLMASLLGSSSINSFSQLVRAADYTGPVAAGPPGPTWPQPDGTVNIIDLVLVAKNFGTQGPINGTPPPNGTFPF